jgi:hypothetical protein
MTLLRSDGKASTTRIAKAILEHDQSQIEYYEKIVGNMVGRVLRSHGLVKKEGSDYLLCIDEKLTKGETAHLVELCREKLTEYEAKRGEQIWHHRKLSNGYISGTLETRRPSSIANCVGFQQMSVLWRSITLFLATWVERTTRAISKPCAIAAIP